MTTALQGIMKRDVPYSEWHEQKAWIETCPQCGEGQAAGVKEMPRSEWGEGLGAHETIRTIKDYGNDSYTIHTQHIPPTS